MRLLRFFFLAWLAGFVWTAAFGRSLCAAEDAASAKAFLSTYCIACHTTDDPSGEREFETLGFALEGFDPIGREREYYDAKGKHKIIAQVRDDDYPLADLIAEIVTSDLFRNR